MSRARCTVATDEPILLVCLTEDVLQLNQQIHIQTHGKRKQDYTKHDQAAHARTDSANVLHQLLLLQRVAVGGLAHALQLVLHPLECRSLLDNLRTQLTMTRAQLADPTLDRLQIDMDLRRWLVGNRLRSQQCTDCRHKVAIEQRQQLLH